MKGYIIKKGGGTGKLFAAIGVTYPEGSTCICIGEGKTWTAKTIAGQWVFPVPKIGTYTVSCFDGEDYDSSEEKTSETVEITTEGQYVSVELDYGYYLYKDGDEYTAITGGWIAIGKKSSSSSSINAGAAIVTRNADNIFIDNPGDPGTSGVFVCQNRIDLSNVSKIILDGTIVSESPPSKGYAFCGLAVWTTLGTYTTSNQVASVNVEIGDRITKGLELDVSSLNDTAGYIVGLKLFRTGTVEMREVELV